MAWPPTPDDMLRLLAEGRVFSKLTEGGGFPVAGVWVYDPKYLMPLVADGLAVMTLGWGNEWFELTPKGREAVALLPSPTKTQPRPATDKGGE